MVVVIKVKNPYFGGVRRGFEGGQMPLYRRLPKFGFTSMKSAVTAEVRLNELTKVEGGMLSPLEALKLQTF